VSVFTHSLVPVLTELHPQEFLLQAPVELVSPELKEPWTLSSSATRFRNIVISLTRLSKDVELQFVSVSFRNAAQRMCFARAANFNVDNVSFEHIAEGDTFATTVVLEFPPSESRSKKVSLLSR